MNNTTDLKVYLHDTVTASRQTSVNTSPILRPSVAGGELQNDLVEKQPIFSTLPSDTTANPNKTYDTEGISWGLIVPIVLIGVFLICVPICLYWYSWRDKRRRVRGQRNAGTMASLSRDCPTRSSKLESGLLRSSMRSTTPLRLINTEKINPYALENDACATIRESLIFENEAWRYLSPPVTLTQPKVLPGRKLSPIDESPRSGNDRLKSCSISAQASLYDSGWTTPQAPPPSRNGSDNNSPYFKNKNGLISVNNTIASDDIYGSYRQYDDTPNSSYYPNNNTPTTECDVEIEQGVYHVRQMASRPPTGINSHFASYPSSLNASVGVTAAEIVNEISMGTSVSGVVYPPSSRRNSFHPPTRRASVLSDSSDSVSGTLSLPSSIARYHQSRMYLAGNVIMPEPRQEQSQNNFNYTLASSVDSADTQFTENGNLSMFPNMGSCNTSTHIVAGSSIAHSHPGSTIPSRNVSADDYSRYLHDLSSIRVDSDDANAKTGSCCGNEGCTSYNCSDLFRSWSATAELDYSTPSSRATASMNVPPSNTNYVWEINPERCLSDPGIGKSHIHDHSRNMLHRLSLYNRRVQFDVPAQVTLPVLNQKQYWV